MFNIFYCRNATPLMSLAACAVLLVGCGDGTSYDATDSNHLAKPSAITMASSSIIASTSRSSCSMLSSSEKKTCKPITSSSPTPVPNAGIIYGVNGHDGRIDYPLSQTETRFQLLNAKNIRSYRVDVGTDDVNIMDTLVPLAKKYGIILRPMLRPSSQTAVYNFVKRYGADIAIWEIGNEINLMGKTEAQRYIPTLLATYNGIQQASIELNRKLETTINFTTCNDEYPESSCYNDKNGDAWFLDMAWQAGIKFDYISFHYYAFYGDAGYWTDKYLSQMRSAATKYQKKIFFNELNCAEIFRGTTDGGYLGDKSCYDSIEQLTNRIREQYMDIVQEINLYEMLDQPNVLLAVPGPEAHFGLMYDITRPKEVWGLLVKMATPL